MDKPEVVQTLTITLKSDGTVDVVGPIVDKVLSYGLLEYAKDAIFEHHMKLANKSVINRLPFLTKGH